MIFDNCIIMSPDEIILSRCCLKKIQWYVDRGLADRVPDAEPQTVTIKLRFEPSGRTGIDDPLIIGGKPNLCVVCGATENLTRHHIVPRSFIRHMPVEWKVDIIRDIFPLCRNCHENYERKSDEKREAIAKSMGGVRSGFFGETMAKGLKAASAASAILKHGSKIPQERKLKLLKDVWVFSGIDCPSEEDLKILANYDPKAAGHYISLSERLAKETKDYNEFAKDWRRHFVETMSPKYMPEVWKIDRKIGTVWIPKKMRRQVAT
jgi:exonuclease 3'-5' domain-containing protein 2